MTEREKSFFLGIALTVGGVGFLVFGGGSETSSGDSFEVFGGRDENRPMSRGASFFWGFIFLIAGVVMIACSWPSSNVWPS